MATSCQRTSQMIVGIRGGCDESVSVYIHRNTPSLMKRAEANWYSNHTYNMGSV